MEDTALAAALAPTRQLTQPVQEAAIAINGSANGLARGHLTVLSLGPMPDAVRAVVKRLVAEARPDRPHPDERLNGFLLTGGPGGASYVDADGEVWNWFCDWNGSGEIVELVPDGPMKVGLIVIAAERVPELAVWLPSRPFCASDCGPCQGSGWLLPPLPRILCPECRGMGWLP